MERCDVLIVGGGPAGSSCARRLASAGMDVLVLDKAVFPRDKVCAGWISPAVIDELELDVADYAKSRVFQPISAFRIGLEAGPTLEIDYPRPVSYGIRRCEFDHYLLERCGARLRLGEAVKSLVRESDGWVINDRYRAPMLVGAGGHFCPVAQWLQKRSGKPKEETLIAAQEAEFLLDERQRVECRVEGHQPELYFCRDLSGYGWCFRKGDYVNVGLGRFDPRRLPEQTAAFHQRLQDEGRLPAGATGKFRGHAYLLFTHANREMVGDGVLLVGDAAGLAYAESGEGIRPAIESGLLAANVLLGRGAGLPKGHASHGAAAGDGRDRYRREFLEHYRDLLEHRFGPRRVAPRREASRLRRTIAALLMRQRWFVRKVVLDRWFLRSSIAPLD